MRQVTYLISISWSITQCLLSTRQSSWPLRWLSAERKLHLNATNLCIIQQWDSLAVPLSASAMRFKPPLIVWTGVALWKSVKLGSMLEQSVIYIVQHHWALLKSPASRLERVFKIHFRLGSGTELAVDMFKPLSTAFSQYFYHNKHLPTGFAVLVTIHLWPAANAISFLALWNGLLRKGFLGVSIDTSMCWRHWSYRKFRIETIGCTCGETNHVYLLHHFDEYIEDMN